MKYFKLGHLIMTGLALALLLVPAVAVQAQTQNADILKIFNEVINQHNPDEAVKYFTDDAVINFPGIPPVQGKAAIAAFAKQSGLFADDPTLKVITPPHVEGNKVLERTSSLPPQFSQQGEAGRLVFDSVTEFQGDKIKSFTLIPTPETLQKLAAAQGPAQNQSQGQGQGGAPGAPATGEGGLVTASEGSQNWLVLGLLLSGAVIMVFGVSLLISRWVTRHKS